MEPVVSKDQATKEVSAWMDRMDVPVANRDRDVVKELIDGLVADTMNGWLMFNDDGTITQKLKFPLADGATKELQHSFRYQIGEFNKATKGISAIDEVDYCMSRLVVINANSPKLPRAAFDKMDGADYKVCKKITVFF